MALIGVVIIVLVISGLVNMMSNRCRRKDHTQLEEGIMREGRVGRKNNIIRKRETCWDSKKLSSKKLKRKERC